MKQPVFVLFIGILLFGLMVAGCGGKPIATAPQAVTELTVSAAVSLKDALAEIRTHYEKKNPGIKLIYNLGASGTLQKQIEQGAPADLFISAAPKQMNELEQKNLLNKATRKNLVENKLVLIVPENSKLKLEKFEDLNQPALQKLAIGEPSVVPAGQYAKQVLEKLALWDAVKDKTVLAKDVRTVLTYVETGNVEAGIVYKTDAAASKKVKIAADAPAGSHDPILYPVAVLSGSKQAKAAEEFLNFLFSAEAGEIFMKRGFSLVIK
jgi:molybdate transport system substrate-binding protein